MDEKCKHENEYRSHLDLNDAAGDEWLTQLWYECTVCRAEVYIELRMDFEEGTAKVTRMNESYQEDLK